MINYTFRRELHESIILKIKNQFGEIEINLYNTIYFPYGLIGMPQHKKFCLANINHERFQYFKLLQDTENHSLGFLTFPIDIKNQIIDKGDLEEACDFLGMDAAHIAILLISSTKMVVDRKKIIVNARAPVLIDTARNIAIQYVIPNTKYDIQYILE